MGTLTGLLDLSRNALLADQTAINAVAQNISNQNTPGYARRVVTMQIQDSVSIGGSSVGAGLSASVSVQRDAVLDGSVQQQASTAAASSARSGALQQLQSVFSIGSGGQDSSGIGAAVSALYTTASALASNGSSAAARSNFLSAAQGFAGSLNRASNAVNTQQASLDQQVVSATAQVNQLASRYANINGQILRSGAAADAGSLEDQRQAILDQISQLVGAHQVRTEGNGISLTLANGSPLVTGDQASALSTTVISGRTHVLASNGSDLTGAIRGGSLGGVLQARDIDLPQVSHSLDLLAFAVGQSVNQQNAAGTDANGNPGGDIFNLHSGQATAAAIEVSLSDPNGIAAAGPGEGAAGGANAGALASLASAPLSVLSGKAPSSFFTSFLSALGSTVSSADTAREGDASTLSTLQTRRDQTSGISLDQEGADLTQYQRSYEVASKLLSIVNSLLASAINIGTPTSVS